MYLNVFVFFIVRGKCAACCKFVDFEMASDKEKSGQHVLLSFSAGEIYPSAKMESENVREPINRTDSLSFSVQTLFYFA